MEDKGICRLSVMEGKGGRGGGVVVMGMERRTELVKEWS